jgi:hypothetical protein
MPGTRSSCSGGPASPWRDVSCSAALVILVLSGARDGAQRLRIAFGAHGTRSQSFRRLRFGRRPVVSSSATTGSATRVPENLSSAAAPLGPFLRFTGLPSRSALVAPPLRLAALRWREAFVVLGRLSATSGRLDGLLGGCDALSPSAPFPGEPHTVLCPSRLERWRHNAVYCTPAVARCRVLSGARDSRALRSSRRAHRWEARLGVHGTRSQSVRRLRFGRRPDFPSSAMTGSATTFPEKQGQAPDGEERYLCQMSVPVAWTDSGAGQWLWSGQNVVTLRLGGPDAR